jgi:protease I
LSDQRLNKEVSVTDISDKRIAILAADGFEQSELMIPKQRLEEAGAAVDIISLKTGEIWGWDHDDWAGRG